MYICTLMNAINKAYWGLHISIFLWGFTAILGKLISLDEIMLVWHRIWITCLSFLFIPGLFRGVKNIPNGKKLIFAGIGVLVAMHWVAFYGAIKYSNVSVALSAVATTSLFTAISEPFILRQKFKIWDLLMGILVIIGIAVIFSVGAVYTKGLLWGIAAAFLASTFSILNKKYLANYEGKAVSFIEMSAGFGFLCLVLPFTITSFSMETFMLSSQDLFLLLLLGVGCTTMPYILSLNALRHISAFNANMAINLEPIYGIILAALIFKENDELSSRFYVGTFIILAAIFIRPIFNFVFDKYKNVESKG